MSTERVCAVRPRALRTASAPSLSEHCVAPACCRGPCVVVWPCVQVELVRSSCGAESAAKLMRMLHDQHAAACLQREFRQWLRDSAAVGAAGGAADGAKVAAAGEECPGGGVAATPREGGGHAPCDHEAEGLAQLQLRPQDVSASEARPGKQGAEAPPAAEADASRKLVPMAVEASEDEGGEPRPRECRPEVGGRQGDGAAAGASKRAAVAEAEAAAARDHTAMRFEVLLLTAGTWPLALTTYQTAAADGGSGGGVYESPSVAEHATGSAAAASAASALSTHAAAVAADDDEAASAVGKGGIMLPAPLVTRRAAWLHGSGCMDRATQATAEGRERREGGSRGERRQRREGAHEGGSSRGREVTRQGGHEGEGSPSGAREGGHSRFSCAHGRGAG